MEGLTLQVSTFSIILLGVIVAPFVLQPFHQIRHLSHFRILRAAGLVTWRLEAFGQLRFALEVVGEPSNQQPWRVQVVVVPNLRPWRRRVFVHPGPGSWPSDRRGRVCVHAQVVLQIPQRASGSALWQHGATSALHDAEMRLLSQQRTRSVRSSRPFNCAQLLRGQLAQELAVLRLGLGCRALHGDVHVASKLRSPRLKWCGGKIGGVAPPKDRIRNSLQRRIPRADALRPLRILGERPPNGMQDLRGGETGAKKPEIEGLLGLKQT
eukprot:scaffold1867_cov247-Pinguiococcus_pyrenoidosus.AAC.6